MLLNLKTDSGNNSLRGRKYLSPRENKDSISCRVCILHVEHLKGTSDACFTKGMFPLLQTTSHLWLKTKNMITVCSDTVGKVKGLAIPWRKHRRPLKSTTVSTGFRFDLRSMSTTVRILARLMNRL